MTSKSTRGAVKELAKKKPIQEVDSSADAVDSSPSFSSSVVEETKKKEVVPKKDPHLPRLIGGSGISPHSLRSVGKQYERIRKKCRPRGRITCIKSPWKRFDPGGKRKPSERKD